MPIDATRPARPIATMPSQPTSTLQQKQTLRSPPLETKDCSTIQSVFETYGVGWVKDDDGSKYVLRSPALDIHAPIDTIWPIVTDVNNYEELTHGVAIAHVDGELHRGSTISFRMFPNKCVGSLIGTSVEKINLIDNDMKIVGWSRHLPIGDGITERYHVLVPVGPNLTRSYIALKMPGCLGGISKLLFGHTILKAFAAINLGIKASAEANQASIP